MAILNEKKISKRKLTDLAKKYGHDYLLDIEYYSHYPESDYYAMDEINELFPNYQNNLIKPFILSDPYFRVDGLGKAISMTQEDVDDWEYDIMRDILWRDDSDFIEWCENKGLLENVRTYRGIKITERKI